jgi:tetratricopeptide (TPR) repeat protein
MNKENILFGIIGLLVGVIVGFVVTNSINQSAYNQTAGQSTGSIALSPNSPQISTQAVKEQPGSSGMMPQIQQALDRAKNEPQNFEAQVAAGDMYYRIQRFDEAANYFEKAVQIKPDDYETLIKFGNARFDAGAIKMERGEDGTEDFKRAEKIYASALAKNPNDVSARTDLGLTYFYRQPKDIERALKEFQASLAINPNHEMTLQVMARALKEKGDNAALQDTLAKLEKVNPNNQVLKQLRGQ